MEIYLPYPDFLLVSILSITKVLKGNRKSFRINWNSVIDRIILTRVYSSSTILESES